MKIFDWVIEYQLSSVSACRASVQRHFKPAGSLNNYFHKERKTY